MWRVGNDEEVHADEDVRHDEDVQVLSVAHEQTQDPHFLLLVDLGVPCVLTRIVPPGMQKGMNHPFLKDLSYAIVYCVLSNAHL